MPAKNSIIKFHGRHQFIDKKLWKKYKKITGVDISYDDFRLIIASSISEIRNWVIREPIGFQFPGLLGHLAINRFKTYGEFKSYMRTRDGRPILNHNLHTGGYTFRIQLFKATRRFQERVPFWYFEACRDFNRSLSSRIKSGRYPSYNTFMQDHFVKIKK